MQNRVVPGGCAICPQKPSYGEQKLFMRIDLHNTAHNGIGVIFADYC